MNNQTPPARTTSTQRATPPIQAPSTRIVSPANRWWHCIYWRKSSSNRDCIPRCPQYQHQRKADDLGHHRRHACRNETKLQGESMAKEWNLQKIYPREESSSVATFLLHCTFTTSKESNSCCDRKIATMQEVLKFKCNYCAQSKEFCHPATVLDNLSKLRRDKSMDTMLSSIVAGKTIRVKGAWIGGVACCVDVVRAGGVWLFIVAIFKSTVIYFYHCWRQKK